MLSKNRGVPIGPALETKASSFLKNPRGQSQKGTFISDALEKQPSVKKVAAPLLILPLYLAKLCALGAASSAS